MQERTVVSYMGDHRNSPTTPYADDVPKGNARHPRKIQTRIPVSILAMPSHTILGGPRCACMRLPLLPGPHTTCRIREHVTFPYPFRHLLYVITGL